MAKAKKAKTTEQVQVEDAKELVTCVLTKQDVEKNQAIEVVQDDGSALHVSLNTVFRLASQPVILNALATNNETFQSIVQFRQQAEAKTSGAQEGAQAVIEALKKQAEEIGMTEQLDTLITALQPPTEAKNV